MAPVDGGRGVCPVGGWSINGSIAVGNVLGSDGSYETHIIEEFRAKEVCSHKASALDMSAEVV